MSEYEQGYLAAHAELARPELERRILELEARCMTAESSARAWREEALDGAWGDQVKRACCGTPGCPLEQYAKMSRHDLINALLEVGESEECGRYCIQRLVAFRLECEASLGELTWGNAMGRIRDALKHLTDPTADVK